MALEFLVCDSVVWIFASNTGVGLSEYVGIVHVCETSVRYSKLGDIAVDRFTGYISAACNASAINLLQNVY